MFELFHMGGPLFMSILTLQLVAIIFIAFRYVSSADKKSSNLDLIKSVGLFAMISGILAQLIGLFSAFQAIEQAGTVSPAMLAGGLKVSMISTIYGMLIYAISYLIWFGLRLKK